MSRLYTEKYIDSLLSKQKDLNKARPVMESIQFWNRWSIPIDFFLMELELKNLQLEFPIKN